MKEPKLYFLLKNLSREEFKRLRKAVMSPIYTTNPKVISLFEGIRGQYPNFKYSNAMRTKLYTALFPNHPFNDQKLRRVFTDLTKVVEQFYVHLELEKQPFKKEKLLTQAYGNRNMYDLFKRRTHDMLEEIEKGPFRNADYFSEKMSLLKDLYSHPQHNKYDKNDETLEVFSDSLDGFYSLSKMRVGVALKNRMNILKGVYRLRFLEAVEKERKEGFLADNAVFQLYSLAIRLAENSSWEVFEQYELKLFADIKFLDEYDQKSLFYNGLNFIVREYNRGHSKYGNITFVWFQFGLQEKLLFQNDQLSAITFGNIVISGCREQAFDWVDYFINNYNIFLKESIRTEETVYSKALVNFYKLEFDLVIERISNYSFSEPYKLRTRTILLRTYFELFLLDNTQFFVFINYLISFENYLYKNNSFKKARTDSYFCLIRILKGLAKRILKKEKKDKIDKWLITQLNNYQNVSGREWLIKKFKLEINN